VSELEAPSDRHAASRARVEQSDTRLWHAVERSVVADIALAATEASAIAAALGAPTDPVAQATASTVQAGATAIQAAVDRAQQQADRAQRLADAVQQQVDARIPPPPPAGNPPNRPGPAGRPGGTE